MIRTLAAVVITAALALSTQPASAADPIVVTDLNASVVVTDDACEVDSIRIDYAEGVQWYRDPDIQSDPVVGEPIPVARPFTTIPMPLGYRGRLWAEPLPGYTIPDEVEGSAANPFLLVVSAASVCSQPPTTAPTVTPDRAASERKLHRKLAKLRKMKKRHRVLA